MPFRSPLGTRSPGSLNISTNILSTSTASTKLKLRSGVLQRRNKKVAPSASHAEHNGKPHVAASPAKAGTSYLSQYSIASTVVVESHENETGTIQSHETRINANAREDQTEGNVPENCSFEAASIQPNTIDDNEESVSPGTATVRNSQNKPESSIDRTEDETTTFEEDVWDREYRMVRKWVSDELTGRTWESTAWCGIPDDRRIKRSHCVPERLTDRLMASKFNRAVNYVCVSYDRRPIYADQPILLDEELSRTGFCVAEHGNVTEEHERRSLFRLLPFSQCF